MWQSGSIGSVVGNPFDVMKTKMMTAKEKPSLGRAVSAMYHDQGIKGFYRGISVGFVDVSLRFLAVVDA